MPSKTNPETPVAFHSRALEHGAGTWGARSLEKGFARTPADDLLFALGYPHLALLTDEPAPRAEAMAEEVMNTEFFLRETWPASLAPGLIRGDGTPVLFVEGPFGPQLADGGPTLAAFADRSPMQEAEGRAWLLKAFTPSESGGDLVGYRTRAFFLLEALFGPSFVWQGFRGALAKTALSPGGTGFARALHDLGFLLLRLPVKESEEARAVLRGLLEAGSALARADPQFANPDAVGPVAVFSLDLVLHGKEAALRDGARTRQGVPNRHALLFVHDDPAFVREVLEKRPIGKGAGLVSDARLAFLGGKDVLDLEAKQWPFYTSAKGDQPCWLATFGRIADDRVLDLAVAMALTSKNAKKEALALLQAHPVEARAACARRGDEALALLKKLGAAR